MTERAIAEALADEDLAKDFAALFDEQDQCSMRVMQTLGQCFGYVGVTIYDRGAADPSGQTLVRVGHQEVLQFIGAMIAKGNQSDDQSS